MVTSLSCLKTLQWIPTVNQIESKIFHDWTCYFSKHIFVPLPHPSVALWAPFPFLIPVHPVLGPEIPTHQHCPVDIYRRNGGKSFHAIPKKQTQTYFGELLNVAMLMSEAPLRQVCFARLPQTPLTPSTLGPSACTFGCTKCSLHHKAYNMCTVLK